MSNLPSAPGEKPIVPLEYGKPITEFAAGIQDAASTADKTASQTAKILAFVPRAKPAPEQKPTPAYTVGAAVYNPIGEEAKQNELIGQILGLYNFSSKTEQLSGQKWSLDKVENLIETRFHQTMQASAKEDVQNGVFGWSFTIDPRAKASFASIFGRSLLEEFNQTIEQNQSINWALRGIYNKIVISLLTDYGKTIINQAGLPREEVGAMLESIRLRKDEWKKLLYDTVLIPQNLKKPIRSLLEAFVENYVVPVWELETAQRKAHEAETAKSA